MKKMLSIIIYSYTLNSCVENKCFLFKHSNYKIKPNYLSAFQVGIQTRVVSFVVLPNTIRVRYEPWCLLRGLHNIQTAPGDE